MRILTILSSSLLLGFSALFFMAKKQPVVSAVTISTPQKSNVAEESITTQQIVDLANAFKATLSATQIASLEYTYSLANAKKWSNLPVTMSARIGLRFGDLNATQLAAAKALIQAAAGTTANEGYAEIQQLWAADDYLSANGGGTTYGSGQYYIAFIGTPTMTGTWELQTGGHHLAFANTYKNGVLAGATPSFRAVEPFAAFTSGGNTYQPLVQDRDALAAMLNGLTTTQQTTARLSSTFSDILLGPNKDWQFPTVKSGVKCSDLTEAQRTLVLNAIRTYVNDIDDAAAAEIMATYTSQIGDTYVAFSGNTSLSVRNDYVRIDGPRVWIEYSVQNGIVLTPTHPHSVWRDRYSDYGTTGNTAVVVRDLAANNLALQHYPNPVSNQANLAFSLTENALVAVRIVDITGRIVDTPFKAYLSEGKNTVTVNLNSLAAGSYRYVIEANGVQKAVKSFVKN